MRTQTNLIAVAGATGNLGGRIVKALRERDANVRALVRPGTDATRLAPLYALGVEVVETDLNSVPDVERACAGVHCVVSALLGLHDVMVETQTCLLQGALQAGVPRFIPSDYAMDFTTVPPGSNRNLDLHREFQQRLDRAPIAATSILNGAFMDLLTGAAPFILFKFHRVLYWENADQPLEFTTMDDTAAFTAEAALDTETPRFLRVVGQKVTARELAAIMSDLAGRQFKLFRAGGLSRLETIIRIVRKLNPAVQEPFPAWQGMQYMRNMYAGEGPVSPQDNDRYPGMHWTQVCDVLARHLAQSEA
jgi:uncharacterized protein YbjT (DUF2867 family)